MDALKAYASAVGFLKSDRSDADWENFLYYPLRSGWLDDVTVLFVYVVYEISDFHINDRL